MTVYFCSDINLHKEKVMADILSKFKDICNRVVKEGYELRCYERDMKRKYFNTIKNINSTRPFIRSPYKFKNGVKLLYNEHYKRYENYIQEDETYPEEDSNCCGDCGYSSIRENEEGAVVRYRYLLCRKFNIGVKKDEKGCPSFDI